jgi:hypothetical protein
VRTPEVIVGHLAPDLDCLVAVWQLVRFGGAQRARLEFVPAGATLDGKPADANPAIVHVDTGGGRFDHHQRNNDRALSASELVRRAIAPEDAALRRLVEHVTRIDNALSPGGSVFFNINDLISGYNSLYPSRPQHVVEAMLPNLDAWYEHEARQLRLEQAFQRRLEFETPWGLGIAMESDDGGSSRLAYGKGAVLYAYRDQNGWMGVAAQARSNVDLEPVYSELRVVDPQADWYLHPGRRLLLCGTAKAPPRQPSSLSLEELVSIIRGDYHFRQDEDADFASMEEALR